MAEKKIVTRSDQECFLIKAMVIDKLSFKKLGIHSLGKNFWWKVKDRISSQGKGTSRE